MKKIVALVLIIALVSTVAATCFAGCLVHSWKVTGRSYSPAGNYYHQVAGCHNCTYTHMHRIGANVTVYEKCQKCTATRSTTEFNSTYEYCPYSH